MRNAWLLRAVLSLSVAGAAVATTSLAAADEASAQDIAQARTLGGQAQAAFDAGNLQESEKLWIAAVNLYPVAPTLSLGLARTQAKLGKFVNAQEAYNRIIREWGNNPSPPPAFKDALEAARAEVGAVSAKVAHVVITVEGPTQPVVTVDGEPVKAAALGLPRPVDPGSHVVKASAEGFLPAETTFEVAESGNANAKLTLQKAPAAVAAAAPSSQPGEQKGPEVGTKSAPNKTLAIAALGVGAAGLVVGGVTGLMAMGKHGDLESKCPNGTCPPDAQGDVDSYKTLGTVSTIGFVVGAVGVAAGAVLWFTAPKERAAIAPTAQRSASTKPELSPYVGLGNAGIVGRF